MRPTKGKIAEVFRSLQGEGLYLGEEQVFVRFFGCNLNCKYCDTRLERFTEYQPKELFDEIKLCQNGNRVVSFTGGEPLLQKNFLKEIMKLTSSEGYKNYLDTNGVLHHELEDVIDYVDVVAMDMKLPSSTGLNDFWYHHRQFLKTASKKEVFLKIVICHSTKEEDMAEALRIVSEVNKYLIIVLQPNSAEEYEQMKGKIEQFRDVCRRHEITACIIPQIHKKIGIS
ncbi:MAG: 7-carboxy-7-deazaguanine synthase QueE [Candidatus Omnitrophota bacterium]